MAEKNHRLFDAQKELESLTLPAPSASYSPSRRPSKFRTFLIRCLHATFILGSLYALHSWLFSSRYELPEDFHLWPVEAFGHRYRHGNGHGILNGERAERIFLQVPDEESARAASRAYATLPHPAGSEQDLVTAKYVFEHFQKSFDLQPPHKEPIFNAGSPESRNATLNIPLTTEPRAWIDTYYTLLNTPVNHSLEILNKDGKVAWSATLEEDGDPLDEDAANARTAVPAFHGFSRSGSVTGEVFYANYGTQEDYDAVERSGTNITGKIALVRYGSIFRGLKVKGAQERGAIGALIYSDPRDDGSVTFDNGYEPYPQGPSRNPTSVQRGSVQFISSYPGDPTTPGYPSYENSTRTNGTNIPSIPSLPISWSTAYTLLQEIGANGQNRSVRLVNNVDNKVRPIWNTMALIPGHIKSEVIVLGNHRDAWVLGAADPSSGTSTVHEIVRGLGSLYQRGWRPLRSILIASWDAEEYGLIGSTEWGEDFPHWISEHVIAYINIDSSVSGSKFRVNGSPSLAHLLKRSAIDVPHPTKEGRTLWDATTDKGELTGPADPDVLAIAEAEEQLVKTGLGVGPLGSGSDYTVFLQRIGVASSDSSFSATPSDPVYHYHSIYDSQRFQELWADPGFYRHVAVSKYLGLVTLRLADSIVLPLNTTHYAVELASYVNTVEDIAFNLKLKVNLSPLRKSIQKLHKASVKLDVEKEAAEKNLWDIIRRWQRRHRHHHHGGHRGHHCRSPWRRLNRWVKKIFGRAGERMFGGGGHDEPPGSPPPFPPHDDYPPPHGPPGSPPHCPSHPPPPHEPDHPHPPPHGPDHPHPPHGPDHPHPPHGPEHPYPPHGPDHPRPPHDPDHPQPPPHGPDHPGYPHPPPRDPPPHRPDFPDHPPPHYPPHCPHPPPHRPDYPGGPHPPPRIPHKLRKAVKRVQHVNKKLSSFEGGFISKGGIIGREWYRHLGVAPGKWLGYGATTLPSITEALTIAKNSTLAEHEAARVTELVKNLTKAIAV